VGLAIGIPLVVWLQNTGIYFGDIMESFGMGKRIHTEFKPDDTVITYLFGVAVAVMGSLYAGLVASRMRLVETLRESA
jgi:ABC-type lipoprotein release transport system permease subunit